jgi:hypothetical protein
MGEDLLAFQEGLCSMEFVRLGLSNFLAGMSKKIIRNYSEFMSLIGIRKEDITRSI